MRRIIRQTGVIARRDFIATVATPTFLLFLLAPFFMLGFALVGSKGASQIAESAAGKAEIAVIAQAADRESLIKADARRRLMFSPTTAPPTLRVVPAGGKDDESARALLASKEVDVFAVLYGPLEQPVILRSAMGGRSTEYLTTLAEEVLRDRRAGIMGETSLSRPRIVTVERVAPSQGGRQGIGFAAVFVVFFLTLLLAGQAVGMLAEEKANKVIEILAAAVPLETVFLGKLIGMFGVALLFVGFWGTLCVLGIVLQPQQAPALGALTPAIGMPLFVLFGAAYFTMAYLLLGAVFLGVGAQASTVREIQMLSLPITIFQVGMFGLSSAAASNPGTDIALFAEILPFSSPFAMAAHGASDPRIWPHLAALAWQILWVALTITFAARMFRRGVLKSGSGRGLKALLGRRRAMAGEQALD